MHLPKLILGCRRFSCFSCMLSMRMNLSNWKIAKYKSQLITKNLLNLFDYRIGLPTIRTLIISIFHDMYRGFLTYFERLNQLYRDYILNIQRANESYNESIKLIERMNEIYKEVIENYAKMNQVYKQHFEDMQRVNQQWFNLFLRPFMAQQQQQQHQEQEKKEEEEDKKNS